LNGTEDATEKNAATYNFYPKKPGVVVITALLKDTLGKGIPLNAVSISAVASQPTLDSVAFKSMPKLGEPLSLIVKQTNPDSTPYRLFVTGKKGWSDTTGFRSSPFNTFDTFQLSTPIISIDSLHDTIFTVDTNGFKSKPKIINSAVSYSLPTVVFTVSDTIIVTYAEPDSVSLSTQSTGNKFIWVLDSTDTLKPDSLKSTRCLIPLSDSLPHMLTVTGVDQYGNAGTPSSIPIRAQNFTYLIKPVSFPTVVKAKTLTLWIAGLKNPTDSLKKGSHYRWSVYPANYSTIELDGPDSGTLKLNWADFANTTISLWVVDSANHNESAIYSQSVTAKRFAPSIKFTNSRPYSRKTIDVIDLTVSAADSNSDGTISKILWERKGKSPAKDTSTDSSWQFSYTYPDTFEAYAWAIDNDGFVSQPDSIQVMVKAFRPYFQTFIIDTSGFLNDTMHFTAIGNVSDSTSKIVKYLWSFSNNGMWTDSAATGAIAHAFSSPGIKTVVVKCRDNNNLESAPDTFSVTISTGAPIASSMKPDTVWIDDDTLYTITAQANPTTTLKQWVVQWDALGPWDTVTTDTLRHAYASAGLKQLTYFVIDKNGTVSNSVNKSITVLLGAPSITSVGIDSALSKIFINDSLHFTVHGFDPNGAIDSIKVSWTGDTNFSAVNKTIQGNASVFTNAFATSGAKQIRFRVYDDDGLSKDTILSINVQLGKPLVSSISLDTPSTKIFINQAVKYTVTGHDGNGRIDSIKVSWINDSTAFTQKLVATSDAATFTYAFTTTGPKQIRFRVYDNDGLTADSVFAVLVHLGKPKVLSFTPDSAVFIKRAYTYTVNAIDTNGTVSSFYVSWDGGAFAQATNSATSGVATLSQTLTSAGKHSVLVYVKDNDGLYSDTLKDTIVVRLCAPVISHVSGDTLGNNIFVNDKRTFYVSARDTNGFVRKIYFNWDGGTGATPVAVDSIVIPLSRNLASIDTFFQHVYDTTMSSPPSRIVRVWARDDDSIVSTGTKDTTISVRLGRPVLWGDKGDTLWIPIANGPGTYYMHVNTIDTNGINSMPVNWYWNSTNTLTGATISQVDSVPIDILQGLSPFPIGSGQARYIFARDNDSLIGYNITGIGHPFFVYADSAPSTPTISYSKVNGQIQIGWLGKDAKDGNGTLFEILLKKGSAPANTDTLFNFKSGTTLSPGLYGYDFSYTFGPSGGAGTYYYQVVAKDARGSISYSTVSFFIFP
jgi:hypothetical protein